MVGDTTVGQAQGCRGGQSQPVRGTERFGPPPLGELGGVTVGESGWDASPSVTDSIETGTPRAASSDASAPTPEDLVVRVRRDDEQLGAGVDVEVREGGVPGPHRFRGTAGFDRFGGEACGGGTG